MTQTLRVRMEPNGQLAVETQDGRWLALREANDCNPVTTIKYLIMNASERAIGLNGNPTRAQHEYFEKIGHSWLDEDNQLNGVKVKRGETGLSGAQQAALDRKRLARLEELGLSDVTIDDLI